jgi:hypothetical protein
MWLGEPHPFPERGSPTILSTLGQQRYEGRSCKLLLLLLLLFWLLLLLLQQIHIFVSVNITMTISIIMNHVKTHVLKQSFSLKIGNSLGLLRYYISILFAFRLVCLLVPLKGNKVYNFRWHSYFRFSVTVE